MSTFTFERGLNKKGFELIEAYKVFLDSNTSSFVKEAIKKSIQNEKALKVRKAIQNEIPVEEFVKIVSSYEEYMSGAEEKQEAAIVFVTNNIPTDFKVDVIKGNKSKVIIQKRVGLKSTDFQKYFGTSAEETEKFYNNGFAETFVDTRIRKCLNDIINSVKSKDFKITLSECFKEEHRKLYNIAVNFEVSVDKLNSNICEEITEVITLIEKDCVDFTL